MQVSHAQDISHFFMVGLTPQTAPMMVRDAIFLDHEACVSFLKQCRSEGLGSLMAVSTCDRLELYGCDPDPNTVMARLLERLADFCAVDAALLQESHRRLSGQAALHQLFKLTAALDSVIVGETQVVGQVRDAYEAALQADSFDGLLHQAVEAAFATSKQVRSQTRIGEGPVSIAAVAVRMAMDLHGDLSKSQVLLIGAGDMGERTARHFLETGVESLTCLHPMDHRARRIARGLSCHAGAFADRDKIACQSDVIITSLNKRNRAVSVPMVQNALKKRKKKPIFLIDTGVPGDVDPAVHKLDGAFVYDLHDLESLALMGRGERQKHAAHAVTLVDEAVQNFLQGQDERAAVPLVRHLRDHFEEERQAVLARSGDDAAAATRLLINRLLHTPSEVLRSDGGKLSTKEWQRTESLIRRLFLKETNT